MDHKLRRMPSHRVKTIDLAKSKYKHVFAMETKNFVKHKRFAVEIPGKWKGKNLGHFKRNIRPRVSSVIILDKT